MDLDALATKVRKLEEFQKRIETMVQQAGRGPSQDDDETSPLSRLRLLETQHGGLHDELIGLKEQLQPMELLKEMAEWFAKHRGPLETVLAAAGKPVSEGSRFSGTEGVSQADASGKPLYPQADGSMGETRGT